MSNKLLLYLSVLVGPVVGTAAHGGGAGSGADTGTGKDGSVHCDGDVWCGELKELIDRRQAYEKQSLFRVPRDSGFYLSRPKEVTR